MVGGLPANRTVNGFAVDPENPRAMYVAMRDGLFKSTNVGETWTPLGKELRNMAAVALNPKRPGEVYASTTDGAIFKSIDGGMTWKGQQ